MWNLQGLGRLNVKRSNNTTPTCASATRRRMRFLRNGDLCCRFPTVITTRVNSIEPPIESIRYRSVCSMIVVSETIEDKSEYLPLMEEAKHLFDVAALCL